MLLSSSVISVQFDPRAMRLASEDLAQAVLEAAQQASEEVATRTQELMNELMPEGGLNVGSLLSNDFSSLPEDAAEAINTVSRGTDPVRIAVEAARMSHRGPSI